MKRLLPLLLLACSLLGCKQDNEVLFGLAQNYFVRNDVAVADVPDRIISQEQLLDFFGMAAVMGVNGLPTDIDFDNTFVIPIVCPETNHLTEIVIDSVMATGSEQLTVTGHVTVAPEELSYTMVPFVLLIVDQKYKECDIIMNID